MTTFKEKTSSISVEMEDGNDIWLIESGAGGVSIHIDSPLTDVAYRMSYKDWKTFRDMVTNFMTAEEEEVFCKNNQDNPTWGQQ